MEERNGLAGSRVAEYLRARILSGELAPSQRIRQEQIAADLGASRIPVREALQVLRHQGLVELRPNAGARVRPFDRDECDLVYRVREQVEPLVLVESVPRLNPTVIVAMEGLQEEIEADRDVEAFLALDREFHRLSYTGCPVTSMLELVDRFWDTTQHYRRTYSLLTGDAAWRTVDTEHRLLLDALRQGDAELSAQVLALHIRRSRLQLARHPEVFGPAVDQRDEGHVGEDRETS